MQPAAALQDPGAAPPADAAWRRTLDGVRRFLFGHDVFISYARADALEYAQALADALTQRRMAAYVDQLGTPPGPKMPPLLLLRLRLSSMLVLVASPAAAASEAVAQEVAEFTRRNHRMFVVDVAGALDGAAWYRERIKGGPARRVTAAELAAGTPSSAVVEQI
ncbi:MAG TPA: TIR domain-containing protein, partial [Longimicrobium sp.]